MIEMEAADAVRGLVEHYSSLRPRKMDLLHDMAESEVFLVDGEALLLEALRDSRCALNAFQAFSLDRKVVRAPTMIMHAYIVDYNITSCFRVLQCKAHTCQFLFQRLLF